MNSISQSQSTSSRSTEKMAELALRSPIISILLLFVFSGEISMVVNAQNAWCVANPAAQEEALHSAVDYACSYVDCSPTVKGGSCFYPDTSVQHASYAMNAYYQKIGRKQWNCNFTNTGLISLTDPSYCASCIFVSGGSGPPLPQKKDTWCVAKPGIPDSALQEIIDFACGVLKDCSKIQEHGSCFLPNTLISHASFAMNLYYKADGINYNCDFNGAGQVVVTNPSLGDCVYV